VDVLALSKVIDSLTDPAASGVISTDAFGVIAPCLALPSPAGSLALGCRLLEGR
jgi:hypothetical protein